MTWTDNNTCPVCEGTAKEALPKMGDFTEVICDHCGRFRITDSAVATFAHQEPTTKMAVLERARAIAEETGEFPLINTRL